MRRYWLRVAIAQALVIVFVVLVIPAAVLWVRHGGKLWGGLITWPLL